MPKPERIYTISIHPNTTTITAENHKWSPQIRTLELIRAGEAFASFTDVTYWYHGDRLSSDALA